ncbi:hypothetical protein TrRE_jg9177 [Triparma retinervis]|uniref:Uncharacterized protein n=1 Tax=Triparma retinervis TaxID=2557542 RepID=A0A9W7C8A5_9STRA|nr:hypothetical protein TrRE_jg9177 [Triparma retinervis]
MVFFVLAVSMIFSSTFFLLDESLTILTSCLWFLFHFNFNRFMAFFELAVSTISSSTTLFLFDESLKILTSCLWFLFHFNFNRFMAFFELAVSTIFSSTTLFLLDESLRILTSCLWFLFHFNFNRFMAFFELAKKSGERNFPWTYPIIQFYLLNSILTFYPSFSPLQGLIFTV